ncbi:MAG: hypothetical protein ABSC06_09715, partial [Rhodopila sp.]
VAPASEPLRRFLQVARGAGLQVSAAEGIDAARALDLVGFEDRTILKDALALVLAKTPEEKTAYEEVFDLYFKRDEFAGRKPEGEDESPSPEQDPFSSPSNGAGGDGMGGQGGQSLGSLLASDDTAALATTPRHSRPPWNRPRGKPASRISASSHRETSTHAVSSIGWACARSNSTWTPCVSPPHRKDLAEPSSSTAG